MREDAGFTRDEMVRYLEEQNIQTRMLFSGNIIKHPCFDKIRKSGLGYRIVSTDSPFPRFTDSHTNSLPDSPSQQLNISTSTLAVTDHIMRDTFWIGVYPGLTEEMINYIMENIRKFVKGKR